jgi:SAM-dependent methyltransferase
MTASVIFDIPHRQRQPEIMDGPGLDPDEHTSALRGLGRINTFSRSGAVLWPAIARLAQKQQPVRVLDLASGGGDIPIALGRRAAQAGLDVRVDGCDISPRAVAYARERAARKGMGVGFFECDVLAGPLPEGYDVLISSLFLHHLSESEAVALLGRMHEVAARLVLVDDLVRSRLGHALAWAGCRLLSGSRVVHHDGPVSVSAAFTPTEAAELAVRAGLEGATVARHWPQRYLLAWSRP